MLSIIRKSEHFSKLLTKKYSLLLEKLPETQRDKISNIHKKEENFSKVNSQFEEEVKQLELKFDKLFSEALKERKEEILKAKDDFPSFWLNALSNHKIFKDFISPSDEEVLKSLIDIRYEKLSDGTSFKLIFEFDKNEFFTDSILEKTFVINEEHMIKEIISTKINWINKEKFIVKKEKKIKNKSKWLFYYTFYYRNWRNQNY